MRAGKGRLDKEVDGGLLNSVYHTRRRRGKGNFSYNVSLEEKEKNETSKKQRKTRTKKEGKGKRGVTQPHESRGKDSCRDNDDSSESRCGTNYQQNEGWAKRTMGERRERWVSEGMKSQQEQAKMAVGMDPGKSRHCWHGFVHQGIGLLFYNCLDDLGDHSLSYIGLAGSYDTGRTSIV